MSLDAWLAFRSGETPKPIKLICCECGKPAQGNVSTRESENSPWLDLCDSCHEADMKEDLPSV